ncbi:MAG: DUF423 domain-containing protein [Bacteroidetes bacterium]|nr:DUF423 domain-containing protein [Bacteroidota bacterium]
MEKRYVIFGSILFCLAIILGAFGAHALRDIIPTDKLNSFEVGVRYQMFQALAILLLSITSKSFDFSLNRIILLMSIGISLFSFSIYLLSLSSLLPFSFKFLGPITPIGGLILIISWIIFIVKLIKN